MKILFIGCTHEQHKFMYSVEEAVSKGDIDLIIHTGDGANNKNPYLNMNPMLDVLTWLDSLGPQVLYSPGNHDTSIEKGLIHNTQFKNVDIVIHESVVFEANGQTIKIFCSPYTPTFGHDWAYNVKRSKIDNYWQEIPDDTDLLVTHGPPKGILDKTAANQPLASVGCKALLNHVCRVKPKIHAFSHIHDENRKEPVFNHGVFIWDDITFINTSMVDLNYSHINDCIVYEI